MCLHAVSPLPVDGTVGPWAALDWNRPWLTDMAPAGLTVDDAVLRGVGVADALNAAWRNDPAPVRFVPQTALPDGEAYERFISETGQVPTRDNLHDLFNGLVWQTFPQSKAALNRLHRAEISANGVGAVRGPVRDAATLFDENGAVLLAPAALWDALLARDWVQLFVTLRPLWAQARLVLFGHALMEQLVYPRKSITAHVLIEQFAINNEVNLDAALAERLTADHLRQKPFTPLPVLGVPGWWPANQAPDFYADTQVFRPRRSSV
ncbi:DUF3025 domain-containing protein [Hydrogenophaga soli]